MAVVSCKVQAPVWDILLVSNLTSGLHICSANVSVDDIMNVSWGAVKTTYTFSAFLTPFPRFRRISVLRSTSRQVGLLYVSGGLRRTYTLFYPRPVSWSDIVT
jgi:hypothetical protein